MLYRSMLVLLILVLVSCNESMLPNAGITHHDIEVTLIPSTHEISGSDKMSIDFTKDTSVFAFYLNSQLSDVKLAGSDDAELQECGFDIYKKYLSKDCKHSDTGQFRYYTIQADSATSVTIQFSGIINDSLKSDDSNYSRGFATTTGLISEKGVYLSNSSAWIPTQETGTFTFDLKTYLPSGWQSVSQGAEVMRGTSGDFNVNAWKCTKPMEEVYLIAGKYVITEEDHNGVKVMTYTYQEDTKLAGNYRGATKRYLDMYSELIGPYAFKKFALVENFWQTGYGMPSFTLLGSQVIRLPFIIHTSYGHEILHNWWGNGVFVDWERGNWCEGITNYMADHYYKIPRRQDADYRRSMLQTYLNYVKDERDFPLIDFRERHNPATQAIGYSKSGMVYHMLYKMLGHDKFYNSLRSFYQDYIFQAVSWDELRGEFEKQAGEDLGWFFEQWIERKGAPVIQIDDVNAAELENGCEIELKLSQSKPAYQLLIPVIASGNTDTTLQVVLKKQSDVFKFVLQEKPKKIFVDPNFDVFRKLDRSEIPPSLSQSIGALNAAIILPDSEKEGSNKAHEKLIRSLLSTDSVVVHMDNEVNPQTIAQSSIWLGGDKNAALMTLKESLPPEVIISDNEVNIGENHFSRKDHSFVLTFRHPDDMDASITWLSISDEKDLRALGRKLPHYGKYGYLVFKGSVNVLKGEWSVTESPLIRTLP